MPSISRVGVVRLLLATLLATQFGCAAVQGIFQSSSSKALETARPWTRPADAPIAVALPPEYDFTAESLAQGTSGRWQAGERSMSFVFAPRDQVNRSTAVPAGASEFRRRTGFIGGYRAEMVGYTTPDGKYHLITVWPDLGAQRLRGATFEAAMRVDGVAADRKQWDIQATAIRRLTFNPR